MDWETAHAVQCSKSRTLTKVIDLIFEIESFEQQSVIIKGLLQSDRLEQDMVTIGINPSLSNSELYVHRCLENIKKLYTYAIKCDDQQQYKAVIEAALVSTADIFSNNGPMSSGSSMHFRNPVARKSKSKC